MGAGELHGLGQRFGDPRSVVRFLAPVGQTSVEVAKRQYFLQGVDVVTETTLVVNNAEPFGHQRLAAPVGEHPLKEQDELFRVHAAVGYDNRRFVAVEAYQQPIQQPFHHRVQFPKEMGLRPFALAATGVSDGVHHPLAVGGEVKGPIDGDGFLGQEFATAAQVLGRQQVEGGPIRVVIGARSIWPASSNSAKAARAKSRSSS